MSDEKKRIIVVEDESSVREMVAKMLASNGYDVEQAQDGLDGLRKVDAARPDLIIADVMMPNLDGLTLIKAPGAPRDKSDSSDLPHREG